MNKINLFSFFILSIGLLGCGGAEPVNVRYHFYTDDSTVASYGYSVTVDGKSIGYLDNFCQVPLGCYECEHRDDYPSVTVGLGEHDVEVWDLNSPSVPVAGFSFTVTDDDLGGCLGYYLDI